MTLQEGARFGCLSARTQSRFSGGHFQAPFSTWTEEPGFSQMLGNACCKAREIRCTYSAPKPLLPTSPGPSTLSIIFLVCPYRIRSRRA